MIIPSYWDAKHENLKSFCGPKRSKHGRFVKMIFAYVGNQLHGMNKQSN